MQNPCGKNTISHHFCYKNPFIWQFCRAASDALVCTTLGNSSLSSFRDYRICSDVCGKLCDQQTEDIVLLAGEEVQFYLQRQEGSKFACWMINKGEVNFFNEPLIPPNDKFQTRCTRDSQNCSCLTWSMPSSIWRCNPYIAKCQPSAGGVLSVINWEESCQMIWTGPVSDMIKAFLSAASPTYWQRSRIEQISGLSCII